MVLPVLSMQLAGRFPRCAISFSLYVIFRHDGQRADEMQVLFAGRGRTQKSGTGTNILGWESGTLWFLRLRPSGATVFLPYFLHAGAPSLHFWFFLRMRVWSRGSVQTGGLLRVWSEMFWRRWCGVRVPQCGPQAERWAETWPDARGDV
ncbi:uncharacterized protein CC84DRAFT_729541 [Paraphaeosphaeria sporulosa]|uniref:Uncharacterized protein n=1 Tax=Paraphaeosphaeria sporulosa TaxID=1460663 RepID=A0A177CFR8_9PLEO|nr:uncharacterized protein CC84DRAFT_729541 [Paraphaeosphaeria sporulosa]OAG05567.1 hypothetical protein CC84DRAFT_729541 [Paraphaeosphaeria sporulosa]